MKKLAILATAFALVACDKGGPKNPFEPVVCEANAPQALEVFVSQTGSCLTSQTTCNASYSLVSVPQPRSVVWDFDQGQPAQSVSFTGVVIWPRVPASHSWRVKACSCASTDRYDEAKSCKTQSGIVTFVSTPSSSAPVIIDADGLPVPPLDQSN